MTHKRRDPPDRFERQQKRGRLEREEEEAVREVLASILIRDLVSVVFEYAPKCSLKQENEAKDRAKMWSSGLRWYVRYFDVTEDRPVPLFTDFGLHELHRPEFDRYVVPLLRTCDWHCLSYWQLRRLLTVKEDDVDRRRHLITKRRHEHTRL